MFFRVLLHVAYQKFFNYGEAINMVRTCRIFLTCRNSHLNRTDPDNPYGGLLHSPLLPRRLDSPGSTPSWTAARSLDLHPPTPRCSPHHDLIAGPKCSVARRLSPRRRIRKTSPQILEGRV